MLLQKVGCVLLPHLIERDNGNVHRAAANIIVSKSRAARGSVCNVLLSDVLCVRVNAIGVRVARQHHVVSINHAELVGDTNRSPIVWINQ